MKVYVFGNRDQTEDNGAFNIAEDLRSKIPGVEFVEVNPNEDVPFADEEDVVIMDVVEGIKEPLIIENEDLKKLVMAPRTTVHDWDLGFQIKYLQKLGKLGRESVIGLPRGINVEIDQLHSILRKLVAQDMQGS